MNVKLVFFAILVVSVMAQKPTTVAGQAQCLRNALGKISDVGKVHAFGIRSDAKIGDSLDIKSLWVKGKTGDMEIKIEPTYKPSKEEVDAKIEVADQVVEQRDLETSDPIEDKISAFSKLGDVPTFTTLTTPFKDQVVDPTFEKSCAAYVVAPHVEFGTAWTFDAENRRVCNQWKEVYRTSECIESDANGVCTKERFSYDENAKRYQCIAASTSAPRVQCVEWKNDAGKSVCTKTETFSAVSACTEYTVVDKQNKCAKSALFYPKFRCVAAMEVGTENVCSKVEAVKPEFFCSSFTFVEGHRFCKTQDVYYGREYTTLSCTQEAKLTEDNCELHCVKYEKQTTYEEELLEFGNEFFVDITKRVETYDITRKIVIIPRPVHTLNTERSIQVTDVYIPVSNVKAEGETTIYPGQIKEFAGMFGAITVDKYESLSHIPGSSKTTTTTTTTTGSTSSTTGSTTSTTGSTTSTSTLSTPTIGIIGTPSFTTTHVTGTVTLTTGVDTHPTGTTTSTTTTTPKPQCPHPDENEVLSILKEKDMIHAVELDVTKSIALLTKEKKTFQPTCDAVATKAARGKLIRGFKRVIYQEYLMIKRTRAILRRTIQQSLKCPSDECKHTFAQLKEAIVAHLTAYIKDMHKSAIIVDHLRRMVVKSCCCCTHFEILHTISKYFKNVQSGVTLKKTIIKTLRKEVKVAVKQAIAEAHLAPAPVKVTPAPSSSAEPSLTITRVLRGKKAILAYLATHHKYFLTLLRQGGAPTNEYTDRFHSWRANYIRANKNAIAYGPAASQCKGTSPYARAVVAGKARSCKAIRRRYRRYVRRRARFARRMRRAGIPLVRGTKVPKRKIILLPKRKTPAQLAAIRRRRAARLAALRKRRAAIRAARAAHRKRRRALRRLARKQRAAARRKARAQRRAARAARRRSRRTLRKALRGRKLISETVYGRKLQAVNTDAALVQTIKSNLITFSAADRNILSQCI